MSVALNPELTPAALAAYLRHGRTYRAALANPALPLLLVENPELKLAVQEARGRKLRADVEEQVNRLGPKQAEKLAALWRGRAYTFRDHGPAGRFAAFAREAGYYAGKARKAQSGHDRDLHLHVARLRLVSCFELLWGEDHDRGGPLFDEVCAARGGQ